MMAAALLLIAAAPETQSSVQPIDPLLQNYSELEATRMWGAHPYCSPRGHERVLRRADARIERIRAALTARFGTRAVDEAQSRRQALFDDQLGDVGAGVACRIDDPERERRYSASLRLHYEEALRPLEAALQLRPH